MWLIIFIIDEEAPCVEQEDEEGESKYENGVESDDAGRQFSGSGMKSSRQASAYHLYSLCLAFFLLPSTGVMDG